MDTNFIARSGDKLYDGSSQLRFISFNFSEALVSEFDADSSDGIQCPTLVPDPYYQEDGLKSIAQAGGTVVRTYTFTYKTSSDVPNAVRHVTGIRTYDETMMRTVDKFLQLAGQYNIRVIIPFIDEWTGYGGETAFSAFRGLPISSFYTDSTLKQDFKNFIYDILNRTNYYTGIKYKDDKTIMAWETGNELNPPDEWTSEMASYIKSIDTNHLVVDGKFGISTNSLYDSNVDIVSNHYYFPTGDTDYENRCNSERSITTGLKPLMIGEFGSVDVSSGYANPAIIHNLLDTVISNGTTGALIWEIRAHYQNGGFRNRSSSGNCSSYRWPGYYNTPGDPYFEEQSVLSLMWEHAHTIRGLAKPDNWGIPDAPILLPISTVSSVNWKGSAGAQSYDVERATSTDGPWTVAGSGVSDASNPYVPFYDATAARDTTYYYRVKANNTAGSSPYSNIQSITTQNGTQS